MQYSNPRLDATIEDWPYGSARTTAIFSIETHPTRGQRAVRETIDPRTGRASKPKTLTYAQHARLVDGEDGRLYIAELGHSSNLISIMQGTMQYQQEVIGPEDARHATVLAFFTTQGA